MESVVAELRRALAERGVAVLTAEPGAGKTTVVPLRLLDEHWLRGPDGEPLKILVLEPRRVATRAAAARMSALLGDSVGATVGYRTRDDTKVGRATHIEVITEGILTRRIQNDPELTGVGLVVFDEFHERSLVGDVALALTLDVRRSLRPELHVLVMSATLDAAAVADLVGDDGPAPVVSSVGTVHPVEVVWRPRTGRDDVVASVVGAVQECLAGQPGDVLVFLPGAREINQAQRALGGTDAVRSGPVDVAPLFGAMAARDQDRALAPPAPGRRKVVLATDIAETSLTVEGVRSVVDSGLVRSPRFDPRTGMSRLVTVNHSRASADQRAGRGGRTGPGLAVRLWSKADHATRLAFAPPEISQVELSGLVLELAQWGVDAPSELSFLDQPPAPAVAEATELLERLGALHHGRLTPLGRRMAELPVHPRLARMVIEAHDTGHGWLGCVLAELLNERDVLGGRPDEVPVDLSLRAGLVIDRRAGHRSAKPAVVEQVRRRAGQLAKRAGVDRSGRVDLEAAGSILGLAYPDRIAQARPGSGSEGPGRFRMHNGTGAWLGATDPLASSPALVVADLDGDRREARIRLATSLGAAELAALTADDTDEVVTVVWDDERDELVERVEQRSGGLVVRSVERAPTPGAAAEDALVQRVRSRGLRVLDWSAKATSVHTRLAFAHRHLGDPWPDVAEPVLLATLEDWLTPFLSGATRRRDLQRVDVAEALLAHVGYPQAGELGRLLPESFELPGGRRRPLDYGDHDVVLSARAQDLYPLESHPTVLDGTVSIVVELLSPAQRPIQRTADLVGFWQGSWAEVRKEMRGRYPKHDWDHPKYNS